MVWGGNTSQGRTQLVIVNGNLTGLRYRDEIIRPHVQAFIQGHGRDITLQHDNARPHVARVVTDFLRQHNIPVLPWPAVSPDMSPIEHVWDEMGRRLRQGPNQPLTLADLGKMLIQTWNNILQAFFNRLVSSMRHRCQACINANGGHTRY